MNFDFKQKRLHWLEYTNQNTHSKGNVRSKSIHLFFYYM